MAYIAGPQWLTFRPPSRTRSMNSTTNALRVALMARVWRLAEAMLTLRILLICLATGPLLAAASTQYSFRVESVGPYSAQRAGTVTVASDQWRIDLEPEDRPRPYDTLLHGGQSLPVALNHGTATWYRLDESSKRGLPHSLFDLHRTFATSASNIRVSRTAAPDGGQIVTFKYRTVTDFGGGTSRGEVAGRLVLYTDGSAAPIQPLLLAMDVRTWVPDVDRQLHAALAAVAGTITRVELTVTRSLEGTQPLTETVRGVVHHASHSSTRTEDFTVPAGYSYQKPRFERPAQTQ